MSLLMDQVLVVGDVEFSSGGIQAVNQVRLETSRLDPADTLEIQLGKAKNLKRDLLKVGDPVIWSAGYTRYGLIDEFVGEVTEISEDEPLRVYAKDPMFQLTQVPLTKNYSQEPIRSFIESIWSGEYLLDTYVEDAMPRVSLRCYRKSGRWALWQLRRFGFDVFFRLGRLEIRNPFDSKVKEDRPSFIHKWSIIKNDLKPLPGRKIRVVVTSESDAGFPVSASYGSGEEIRIREDGLDQRGCTRRAKEKHKELAGEGFQGSFETFGWPSAQHSEFCDIKDLSDPSRNRTAYIDRVTKVYDVAQASYRQTIYPGRIPDIAS